MEVFREFRGDARHGNSSVGHRAGLSRDPSCGRLRGAGKPKETQKVKAQEGLKWIIRPRG